MGVRKLLVDWGTTSFRLWAVGADDAIMGERRSGEASYTVYDVVGWRGHRGQPVMRIVKDIPDRRWFGEMPRILVEHRGEGVDELIEAVHQAAIDYPWKTTYKVFPGPNSNTFTAWVARQVPQLNLELPFTAIGSGYATYN